MSPTFGRRAAVEALKENVKEFRFTLEYHGPDAAKFYSLQLSVSPLPDSLPPSTLGVRITEADAAVLIGHLANDGCLYRGTINRSKLLKTPDEPYYRVSVQGTARDEYHEFVPKPSRRSMAIVAPGSTKRWPLRPLRLTPCESHRTAATLPGLSSSASGKNPVPTANLTVCLRGIWPDEQLTDGEKLDRMKWLNEIQHRVIGKLRTSESWPDAEFFEGVLRVHTDECPPLRGEVGWAVKQSYEYASAAERPAV